MINIELMTKLYLVVAHNLNEARKASDRSKAGKQIKEPDTLNIGDNMLVRDCTSKDFCIVGILGKKQVEVKDNHGYITKVHRRDVKKISMPEKVSQIYKEKQIGKTRNGQKRSARQQNARLRMAQQKPTRST